MPQVLKDSKELCNFLDSYTCTKNVIIGTLDFVSLYTNVDINATLAFLAIKAKDQGWSQARINCLTQGVKYVMNNNYFQCRNQFYLQIWGMAMGTNCAPPLGNSHVVDTSDKATLKYIKMISHSPPHQLSSYEAFKMMDSFYGGVL